jgi:hypothetical protein
VHEVDQVGPRDGTPGENGTSIPGSKETIPMQYNAASTLEFTVEPNKKNIADFNLKSGGPIAPKES